MDLVSTIGESAALGAAGVVMWGATQDYNNKVTSVLTGWTCLLPVNIHLYVQNVAAGGCTVRDLVLFFCLFLVFFCSLSQLLWRNSDTLL